MCLLLLRFSRGIDHELQFALAGGSGSPEQSSAFLAVAIPPAAWFRLDLVWVLPVRFSHLLPCFAMPEAEIADGAR
jgi:hypothetical protein